MKIMKKLLITLLVLMSTLFISCEKESYNYQFTTTVHNVNWVAPYWYDRWDVVNTKIVFLKENKSKDYFNKYKEEMYLLYPIKNMVKDIKCEMKIQYQP